jgi:hypothetical protein
MSRALSVAERLRVAAEVADRIGPLFDRAQAAKLTLTAAALEFARLMAEEDMIHLKDATGGR